MDWVDIDGYNQKGMSCHPVTSYRRLTPFTEHSAVGMDAPERDEPLPAQDPPELSVIHYAGARASLNGLVSRSR